METKKKSSPSDNKREQAVSHIAHTNEACTRMIVNIRQLRLSVVDMFNTLADGGLDPERNLQSSQDVEHHHSQPNSMNQNSSGKLYHQQTLSNLATSHSLCSSSVPNSRLQKQIEMQQQTDLIQYVSQMISDITSIFRNLDQDVALLMQNIAFINTGESVHLGMDSSLDKHNLYMDLCSSYKTYSKLQDYAASCHATLLHKSLKRNHKRVDAMIGPPVLAANQQQQQQQLQQQQQSARLGDPAGRESAVATFNPYVHRFSKQGVVNLLETYLSQNDSLEGTYSQPFGLSTGVFQISVHRVLKAVLVMRGIVIDAVIVKAYHESFASKSPANSNRAGVGLFALNDLTNPIGARGGSQFVDPDDNIDLWSESKYNVFRRLSYHANAAVLHFQYPTNPTVALKSWLSWFSAYSDLFAATCSRCNTRLRKFMPPICRDFTMGFLPHHESCK